MHLAEFDLDRLREMRKKSIWGNAYRRPHKYRELLSRDKDEVWNRIDGNGKPYSNKAR